MTSAAAPHSPATMTLPLCCLQVSLPVADPSVEDAVEGALWTFEFDDIEVAGVERQDDETWSALVEDPRPRDAGSVRWRVHLETDADPQALAAALREHLGSDAVEIEAWEVTDRSFLTAWREHFKPTRVSRRLIVHPPWDVPPSQPGDVLVEIDPGMAFGTGTHETTRLCLAVLDDHVSANADVLDAGCGSGILAIAASKLDAARVVGVDNDPDAVRIAAENAEINGVTEAVWSTTPVGDVAGTFDLVVANILPHVLIALADGLVAKLADDGLLVLSGILLRERERVAAEFVERGLDAAQTRVLGEWSALELRRR